MVRKLSPIVVTKKKMDPIIPVALTTHNTPTVMSYNIASSIRLGLSAKQCVSFRLTYMAV
jgi:hypothetical protein